MKYLLLHRCARCRYNYNYGNFTLSFGRLSQRIPLECLVDVQHGYFPSLNKSDDCFSGVIFAVAIVFALVLSQEALETTTANVTS